MGLFELADGVKVKTRAMKKVAGDIRAACRALDKIRRKLGKALDEAEQDRLLQRRRRQLGKLARAMKHYNEFMVGANAYLIRIRDDAARER